MSKQSADFTTSDECETEALRLAKTNVGKVFYCNCKPNTMKPGVDKVYTYWVTDGYGMWSYCGFSKDFITGSTKSVPLPEGDE